MKPLDKVRSLMQKSGLDGVLLGKRANFAWVTGGKENYVANATDMGEAYVYITASSQYAIANSIEMPRIMDEELGSIGYEPLPFAWHEGLGKSDWAKRIAGQRIGTDCQVIQGEGIVDISAELSAARSILSSEEQDLYRSVARLASESIEDVCRRVEPGWTEHQIRAEVAREAHQRGLNPAVILIATDERVYRYRHPIATDKKLERYAMIVICAERYGLVASSTRFVHFGQLPSELAEKAEKVAYIDAGMIANTKAGVAYRDYFQTVRQLYSDVGYSDEWQYHHQGGPTGYAAREFTITPATEGTIQEGMAFAWNPSIAGTKSEDTIVLAGGKPEVISMTGNWPVIEVTYGGEIWRRPAVLIR